MTTDNLLECIQANDPAGVEAAFALSPLIDARDEHGWTALCWAAGVGNADIVRMLVARGADVCLGGPDKRTPYLIALAAGHGDAARILAQEEARRSAECAERSSQWGRDRPYCRAYPLEALQRYPGWPRRDGAQRVETPQADADGEDGVVFLHRDFTVCASIWAGEALLFDAVTDDWRVFCAQELRFSPPGDLDLLHPPHDG